MGKEVKKLLTYKLRLRDSDKKALGTVSGINPDANQGDITQFIEGVNGLRTNEIAYAFLISEEMVFGVDDN
jgi:hypothetical protein